MDPRLVEDKQIKVGNEELNELVSNIKFYSATYRLFKLPDLEPACEDYGQAIIYKGNIPHYEQVMKLDKHHLFEKGKIALVCGNTYDMIADSRFSQNFEFIGNKSVHYGLFEGCGTASPFLNGDDESQSVSCC